MALIRIQTSDAKIWNRDIVIRDICFAMSQKQPIILDLMAEGPDFCALGLDDLLREESARYSYPLEQIILLTNNTIESYDRIKIQKQWPFHLVRKSQAYDCAVAKDKAANHFGMFINRNNAPRLLIASHLFTYHADSFCHINHLNLDDDFHRYNCDLASLINQYNIADLTTVSNYLKSCPVSCDKVVIDKALPKNPAEQLLDHDAQIFLTKYNDFFIEIVCETYFTGETFFPTEKIWRPILLKTPFIVQGPRHFLKRLKDLGFKTFDHWWDEGYDYDPSDWSVFEIIKLLDHISKWPLETMLEMYKSMDEVLEHNRQIFFELLEKAPSHST